MTQIHIGIDKIVRFFIQGVHSIFLAKFRIISWTFNTKYMKKNFLAAPFHGWGDGVQLSQGYRATARRRFNFYH